ncbi:phosphodiesterase [Sphingomonas parva]|uniref:Phosphodiesterase n=1 Tax=Sphingomonas parva TaxID=2555898 RepID=A0A4Y8ZT78_9SPHN|nr:alkaline phosphatase D family protein [Sphingomonas parva]TFI58707.1 phosphodiesterase [Sphingomonas parva]
MTLNRREFVRIAAALGASLAWSGGARASRTGWREARALYPEGVASGDPDPTSVILWTRRPFVSGTRHILSVEVATDPAFLRVVAHAAAPVSAAADWTARVLVGGLKPATTYWYRFTDAEGNGSRIGRTITAPRPNDRRAVNFAFVSCQSVNEGALNGYRRMLFEDEQARPEDRLDFVLHLGDFIYEVVQYPDEVQTRYDRTIYEVARIPDGLKVGDFHIPTTVDGYRAIWRGYLRDPDLQDARARWPFVCMWDNHEFSWQGWQSILKAGPIEQPGQSVKVAANQAWFEYIPARVSPPSGALDQFGPPAVENVKIERFDSHGLGDEPNNRTAINSLIAYRALRYGRHLDLILTDLHSFRSPDPFGDPSLGGLGDWGDYNGMFPEAAMQVLDGGRAFDGGHPPADIRFGAQAIANPQRDAPPQTLLGAAQKTWFKNRLRRSTATWKIWGASLGTLELRADPENLPPELVKAPWPSGQFANLGGGDHGSAWIERGEIYDLVREEKITGFAVVSGDRHSFWAGYAAKALPPASFAPVGLSFVGASLASPGAMESLEHRLAKDAPLRPLYLADRADGGPPDWTYNMLLRHGVRACVDYARHHDRDQARALGNPALAPHLEFVDMGGHGFAKVRLDGREIRTEFVCIPRPIRRSAQADGGPLRYRVVHRARLWRPGERPRLVQEVLEGDPGLGA